MGEYNPWDDLTIFGLTLFEMCKKIAEGDKEAEKLFGNYVYELAKQSIEFSRLKSEMRFKEIAGE